MRFFRDGLGIDDPGDQSGDGVDYDEGGEFSAGENIVTDRNLLSAEKINGPLINAFISPADNRQMIAGR